MHTNAQPTNFSNAHPTNATNAHLAQVGEEAYLLLLLLLLLLHLRFALLVRHFPAAQLTAFHFLEEVDISFGRVYVCGASTL